MHGDGGSHDGNFVVQMEALMELRPDPAEWIAALGSAGPWMLKQVLETARMQASFAGFFRGCENLDFEITADVPPDAFSALRAMGGSCGYNTFLTAIASTSWSDAAEHARTVWAAMADGERKRFRDQAAAGFVFVWVPYVEVLKFLVLELEIQWGFLSAEHRQVPNYPSSDWQRCFTPELARFVLEKKIKTPAALLALATELGHVDVVEVVARASSTVTEIQSCLLNV